MQEVRPRCLHAVGGFQDRPIKWCQSNFAQHTPILCVMFTFAVLSDCVNNSAKEVIIPPRGLFICMSVYLEREYYKCN